MKFSTPAVSKVVLAVAGLASVVQAGGQHLAARGSDPSKHSQVARKLWKRFSGRGVLLRTTCCCAAHTPFVCEKLTPFYPAPRLFLRSEHWKSRCVTARRKFYMVFTNCYDFVYLGACGGFIGTNDWVVALNTDQFAGGKIRYI